MWTYRRIMKISCKEYRSNKEVLRMINYKKMLVEMIKRRKLSYSGHLVRREGIQRLLLDGMINGIRSRGKQWLTCADNIKEWTGMKYIKCIRMAQDRRRWRSMTADLLGADGTGWWWVTEFDIISLTTSASWLVRYFNVDMASNMKHSEIPNI